MSDESPKPTRSAKRAPGRPAMPVERIVSTALELVDEHGAQALSMRSLAQRLNSGTATLYRHFANRQELVSRVVDQLFGSVSMSYEQLLALPWPDALHTVAQHMYSTLSLHAKAAPLLIEQVPTGPQALMQREMCIARLLAAGFEPKLAARTYTTLAHYVLGFAVQIADDSVDPDVVRRFRSLDTTAFPATVAVADHLSAPLDDEFAFGLHLMIEGLKTTHIDGST
ncbi:MAG: TetR/AcrR family transcriptional regulator [Rhodococcus sp. (in: high G+C Gram-positive bacteria)]|uniref:TetR/AcrR family transcriptional regulator n=1 Tax=unclassified Rhodococcus (in: high G+C Gram-positive bacteria) TaxID=192944 RepID=UPI000964F2CE|nr:TetR/AcrR family transcriptional regulator [Rhodococcus sp. KRD197]OLT35956.1 TetR family transcriptional regulator [Rhodococcus sp. CUA-806]